MLRECVIERSNGEVSSSLTHKEALSCQKKSSYLRFIASPVQAF